MEAVASKVVIWQPCILEYRSDLLSEPGLSQRCPVSELEEWTPASSSLNHVGGHPATGQRGHPVFPTKMSTPWPNWSVLDLFSLIFSRLGDSVLSMATSPHARYPVAVGVVTSPERKKPKKHRSAAAQIMITSGSVARGSKVDNMARRMAGVIGSLVRLGFDACSR